MNEQNTQDANKGDLAYRILRDAPLDDAIKGDIWDCFFESRSGADFKNRLARFDIPDSLRAALLAARKSLEPSARDHVVDAIKHLSQLDPQILATAEAHPNLLRYMLDAAKKESEE